MGQTLVTAGATLLALIVGVLIEPAKNAFAHRARARQLRAERCEEFLAAASALHHAYVDSTMKLSGLFRPAISFETIEDARNENASKMVLEAKAADLAAAIRLYGPDELADAADELRYAAREIDLPDRDDQITHDELGMILKEDRKLWMEAVQGFTWVARRHIAK